MLMPRLKMEFFFEFASTYSYLTVMRLPELASAAGIDVSWRPFLLGPIFATQGWNTSPFNIFPAKGKYMWRDMARRAEQHNLAFQQPSPFPQNGLLAARVAQLALTYPEGMAFCQNVYLAQFDAGKNIADTDVIEACLHAANLPAGLMADAQSETNKNDLRLSTEDAAKRGVFGAPSFLVGDELFWGDDRLEDAINWASRT